MEEQALDLASLNQLCSFNLDATIKIFEEIESLAVELKMGQSAPKLTGFHMIQDLKTATTEEKAAASCMLGYGIQPAADRFPVISQPLSPFCWAGTKLGAAAHAKMKLSQTDADWYTVGKLGIALILIKVQTVDQLSRDKLGGQVALRTLQALDRNTLPRGYCPYLSTITHLTGEPLTTDAAKKFAAYVIRLVVTTYMAQKNPEDLVEAALEATPGEVGAWCTSCVKGGFQQITIKGIKIEITKIKIDACMGDQTHHVSNG